MSRVVFDQHLQESAFLTTPLNDTSEKVSLSERNDTSEVIDLLKQFAVYLSESDADLVTAFETWCSEIGLSEADGEYVGQTLADATTRIKGSDDIDTDDVTSFLAMLGKKQTYRDSSVDQHSHYSEGGTNRFLKTLKVQDWNDAYGNRAAFSASSYKQFPRKGKDYNFGHFYTDFNKQKPSRPLANPILRTTEVQNAFEAVDASGFNQSTGWRCANLLTNSFVSGYMKKEACQQMAEDLNSEFQQEVFLEQRRQQNNLGKTVNESVTRKHFQQVANTVRAIERPDVRQELADHHAEIFSKQNSRFDHSKFHAACGTKTKVERGIKEGKEVANIPIMENLLAPMSPVARAALRHLESSYLKNGSSSSFGDTNTGITAMQDFKAKENLLMEARKRENPLPSEEDAIRAQSVKNMHMRKRNC